MNLPKRTGLFAGLAGGFLLLALTWTVCPGSAQASLVCPNAAHSVTCLRKCLARTLGPLGVERDDAAVQADRQAKARQRLDRAMAGLLDTTASETAYRQAFTEYQAAREDLRAQGVPTF